MWRRSALVLVLVTAWTHPGPAQDEPIESLVASRQWARFDLVLGRITAVQIRSEQSRCAKTCEVNGVHESLSISGDSDIPAIRYELVDAQQCLTIDVVNRNQVTILRQPAEETGLERIEFRQPAHGKISLRIAEGQTASESPSSGSADADSAGTVREYQAESLWHLLLAERDVCEQYLVPILQRLRPGWQLLRRTSQLEDELIRTTGPHHGVTREQLHALLAQLDSPQFAQRREADRRLRQAGVALITFVDHLEMSELSREQRYRIQRIKQDLATLTEDSSQRVAAWLQDDTGVWLAMLSHQERDKRQAAAERLAGIWPDAAQFDPSANEGERQAQINQLRQSIRRR